ncbi:MULTISPECIES: hypothetical protein [unclassified Serratia (in: enterobacteria)]|jgi:hypothetical protein|uniref:hypothetical protein n=1 Tax=unclassified Serratia (in: enterobacteria) TaxID=2647522 RepID=UPI0005057C94|nr:MULTISPECIES: hypothetical protein [unclassified Serratia (in: enterobacteria)]KFK91710.1 hypothetical protein JV45_24760 [Serratia sp. Ag2]KFK98581.1 hypothetical protein IV04_12040 [Serratia sp. Ag1]
METTLNTLKALAVTLFVGGYLYLLTKLVIYTVTTSSDGLVWVLMIGGGAVLLSLVMALAAAVLQPALWLLAAVVLGVVALVKRCRRTRV